MNTPLATHIETALAQATSALTLAHQIHSTLTSTITPETPWRFTPTY